MQTWFGTDSLPDVKLLLPLLFLKPVLAYIICGPRFRRCGYAIANRSCGDWFILCAFYRVLLFPLIFPTCMSPGFSIVSLFAFVRGVCGVRTGYFAFLTNLCVV